MNGSLPSSEPCYAFNPADAEDMATTIAEAATFINAERAALGLPNAQTFLVMGMDIPYAKSDHAG